MTTTIRQPGITRKGMTQTVVVSAEDAAAARQPRDIHMRVQRIDQLARWLDSAIRIPGLSYTIGWDTVIGLIPGAGDLVTAPMSAWIINEARKMGVSKFTLARMIANTSIDALIGSVPVAGDVIDATFKANAKNLQLLRKSLQKRGLLLDT